jgi:hypothetical protein
MIEIAQATDADDRLVFQPGVAEELAFAKGSFDLVLATTSFTTGANGSCSPSYLCTAGPGYDGPTGLGTPNGDGAF